MSVVYALATPPAKSAICVFRVSGEGCLDQIPVLFGSPPKEHGFFCVRDISLKKEVIDNVGLISFKGPKSYTGEDSFEIYGHGGLGVMSLIIDALRSVGFEEAGPGEFTKRAYLNNKITLNQSESVLDVIESSSRSEVLLASQSLSGAFTKKIHEISKKIDSAIVGIGLTAFGIFYVLKSGIFEYNLPEWIMKYGSWIIPIIFLLRAIGEFKYVGFFKSVKKTDFGKLDTKFFSPLCLIIGIFGIANFMLRATSNMLLIT